MLADRVSSWLGHLATVGLSDVGVFLFNLRSLGRSFVANRQ